MANFTTYCTSRIFILITIVDNNSPHDHVSHLSSHTVSAVTNVPSNFNHTSYILKTASKKSVNFPLFKIENLLLFSIFVTNIGQNEDVPLGSRKLLTFYRIS